MKFLSLFMTTLLMLGLAPMGVAQAQTTSRPLTSNHTLADGRAYTFHRDGATADREMPLVIMLHGYAQTSETARKYTNLEAYSDVQGFNVIFAKGTGGKWNSGKCCGGATTDDVQYLKDVVDDISSKVKTDRSRVYIWGFSNGAMMAVRAACEAPGYFAAVGNMGGTLTSDCEAHDIDVRHLHGLNDTTVPFSGGFNRFLNVNFIDTRQVTSALESGATWTPTRIPNCAHEWASLVTSCRYSATGTLWQWSKNFTLDKPVAS